MQFNKLINLAGEFYILTQEAQVFRIMGKPPKVVRSHLPHE